RRADALGEVGVRTVRDLIEYFPRRYLDRSSTSLVRDMAGAPGPVTVVGTVQSIRTKKGRRGSRFELTLRDSEGGFLQCVWFRGAGWLGKLFEEGERLAVHGKAKRYGGVWQITHPDFDRIESDGPSLDTGRIIALYPGSSTLEKAGISSRFFRRVIYGLIRDRGEEMVDPLPAALVEQNGLLDGRVARRAIHFPKSQTELRRAIHRLKFEELFFFQLMLALFRKEQSRESGAVLSTDGPLLRRLMDEVLPFKLTGAQRRVLNEIAEDVTGGMQMNRLLQGDVGSGKTVVALAAVLMAVDSGFQAAFMAPTEILAEQHARTLRGWCNPLGVDVVLLTGSLKAAERREALGRVSAGDAGIVVGTHAVIQDAVDFERLGLCVIDEQHRFGVMQRATLAEKGIHPHILLMTATPIPRSLALTLYGDLDVSVMKERPPGRQPVRTRVIPQPKRDEINNVILTHLEAGNRAYVVYPLVEESEKLDLNDAESGFEAIRAAFPEAGVDLVHGRMKSDEKEAAMARFTAGESQILVSTTVIEVGVDVPEATLMVIEHAERFGLSQLHQLRGRIGRGEHASECILAADFKRSKDGQRRLEAMVNTDDGFEISEVDLAIRGAGDFFGTQQSGLPAFRMADLAEDEEILKAARRAAFDLVADDPSIDEPGHADLRDWVEAFVSPEALRMSRIG
ncbi:MAG: ATP-dependent DNA helicase RecG, partial [Rhodothermales bacterium]|nr:ATP-dependent DNA helicase RecG [Rhodothermales bacterium]